MYTVCVLYVLLYYICVACVGSSSLLVLYLEVFLCFCSSRTLMCVRVIVEIKERKKDHRSDLVEACRQISGRKCGFKSLSQLLEADVKTRSVHQFLKLDVQASLQTVV